MATCRHASLHVIATALLALGLVGLVHAAPGQRQAGDYTIYYNALSGADLPLVSTRAYGLRHTADQGLVTIAVNDRSGANVPLTVSGHASTLLGARVPIKIRYVNDGHGNHSVLVTFGVSSNQTLRFDLDVTPRGGTTTHLHFVHSYMP